MISHNLNILYSKLAESISITDAMVDAAERSYKSVGRHLDGDNSLGETDVYTQGSFALGTVIRPISGEDEDYDIDLVCEMKDAASKPASHIKKAVGRSLEGYRKDTEDEGKRCWTFQYDKFHMDVLPCSPDITHCGDDTAIRLTHKNPDGSYSDRYGNPKGYRDWFIAKAGAPTRLRGRRRRQPSLARWRRCPSIPSSRLCSKPSRYSSTTETSCSPAATMRRYRQSSQR